ncbi:6635_t:CDS:1 [Funneliformis caledonium]|uniref:6635_t:CDS:1 n=1 Tax=Funneliformis caledonium TaxID=1117310 RepID=A0A9N8Z8T9_9GLOM|nr:6635_t:CDS:1 [Funneliformis caledonium]
MANLFRGPERSSYKEFTPFAYFSYQLGRETFQQGYLGITSNVSIVGLLNLRFPAQQPLYAKQIQIHFLGTECVQIQGTGPKVLVYDTNPICTVTIELWKSPDDKYHQIHDMDLPFEIPLPIDIPSSMSIDKGRGKIEYCLQAIISKRSNFRGSEKIIQCAYDVNRYILPPLPEPRQWIKEDPMKQGIKYEISLNNNVFGPRCPIVVRMKLTFYDPRVSLENIVIGLREYTVIADQSEFDIKKKSKYKLKTILKGRQISMTSESQYSECTTDIQFTIPEDCVGKLTWSHESFNIAVFHKLKIKVKFGLFSKYNFNLDVPVKIVNMLSVEEEEYLAVEVLRQQEISVYSDAPPPAYEPDRFTNPVSLPLYSS